MADTKEFIKGEIFSPKFDLEKQYAKYEGVLKGAEVGKVRTRFPPEPSGYLHIGHVKAALLNYHYSKMYKGEMILRFDDTNPSKEKHEFVESILEDLHTLRVEYTKLSYTSDYFDVIFNYGRDLIKKNLAYVDNTDVETMRKQRKDKIESECRSFPIEKNLEIYEKMLKGEADDYCLRAKINMNSDNGCLRDPVLGRTNRTPHQRTGKKYTFYPTYDFACPIVDHLEGVTHAMRTNEYADRIPQYFWVLDSLGFPKHEIYEYSRLNLEHTCLSKRKLQWFVETKRVDGWDDPRFPTVRGVLRKGIRVETLTEFMLEQGPSKRANLMEWQKLWAINKRIIDPICPRYSAVKCDKASRIVIDNIPEKPDVVTVPMSKLTPALGERPLWRSNNILVDFVDADKLIKEGEKVTLMNWGNVQIKTKQLQPDGSYLMQGEFLKEDKDFKSTAKVTWLADGTNLLTAELVEYDHLIKTKKVDEDVDFENIVNVNSKFSALYYVDNHIRTLNAGQFLQFERKGYYKIDSVVQAGNDLKYTLIYTPDGKAVGLNSQGGLITENSEIKRETLEQKKTNKGKKKEEQTKEENNEGQKKEGDKAEKKKDKKKEKKPTGEKKQGEVPEGEVTFEASKCPPIEAPKEQTLITFVTIKEPEIAICPFNREAPQDIEISKYPPMEAPKEQTSEKFVAEGLIIKEPEIARCPIYGEAPKVSVQEITVSPIYGEAPQVIEISKCPPIETPEKTEETQPEEKKPNNEN